MGRLSPLLSGALTAHALLGSGLSIAHSLRARGARRTLLFAGLGLGLPVLAEYAAVNTLKLLRHRLQPQRGGVPVAIALGWYNVGYCTFAMTESVLEGRGRPDVALSAASAAAATSLDLLVDPCGLDVGLWEWAGDGRYAPEISGPNGKRGVPLVNFAGWLALISTVALAYGRLGGGAAEGQRPGTAGSPEAGRDAALLLLPYYLPAAAWAVARRRPRFLLNSAPFAAVLFAALKGRSPAA